MAFTKENPRNMLHTYEIWRILTSLFINFFDTPVELPKQLRIYSHGGALVNTAAAVQEAHPLTLSCRATGGKFYPLFLTPYLFMQCNRLQEFFTHSLRFLTLVYTKLLIFIG